MMKRKIKLEGLGLEEKIGQLLMVGVSGTEITPETEKLIRDCRLGGIILFERNYSGPKQLANLCSGLQSLAASNPAGIPLFIAVDQEGGRVLRFKKGFTAPPAAAELGRRGSPEFVYQIFGKLGEELKAVGINMNMAPVLDVNTNLSNPAIGDRAFGSDPKLVSKLGLNVIRGLQDKGIIAVAKHFPGHGDTSLDSHTHLPRISHSLSRIEAIELSPFRAAVEAGLEAIMTAHVVYDIIDPDNPATLSGKIIGQLLRQGIGFKEVVMSDDLDMGAIVNNYDLEKSAIRAIHSGIDLLLICHHEEHQRQVYRGLLRACQDGLLTMSCVDQSVTRILKLKRKFCHL